MCDLPKLLDVIIPIQLRRCGIVIQFLKVVGDAEVIGVVPLFIKHFFQAFGNAAFTAAIDAMQDDKCARIVES